MINNYVSFLSYTIKKEKTTMKKIKTKLNFILLFSLLFFTSCAQSPHARYVDLTYAAENSVHAVVHIKTEYLRKNSFWDIFFGDQMIADFFGIPSQSAYPVVATGSGVIVTEDGYIITNNHVVADAQRVTITLNDQSVFEGRIVGTDPRTDLALIKIEAQNLPYVKFADSDDIKIGEWVLAVGNPFNLNSTVTAGIISAKARDLNLLGNHTGVAFIQTDAAVNMGNSGGALVNSEGDLIGINTAIASGTGYYAGYSFAVPSNLAKEVIAKIEPNIKIK